MSHSLNEIEALAKRAARGAGLSWGLAEEAGRAVRWLSSHRRPGVSLLADLLARNDGRDHMETAPEALRDEWQAPSGTLCPISSGAALNDCADRLADGEIITLREVACPLLMVPFAAWAAVHIEAPIEIIETDIYLVTDGFDLGGSSDSPGASPKTLRIAKAGSKVVPMQTAHMRGTVDPKGWAQLNAFAHRTYAPATEASRLLGAGAGVSDND